MLSSEGAFFNVFYGRTIKFQFFKVRVGYKCIHWEMGNLVLTDNENWIPGDASGGMDVMFAL